MFCLKSKFWPKIEIFVKNGNFGPKLKFLLKMEIMVKSQRIFSDFLYLRFSHLYIYFCETTLKISLDQFYNGPEPQSGLDFIFASLSSYYFFIP